MIVLHHLGISQSERITWLLEELQLEYKLIKHTRAPAMAPDSLKNIPGNNAGKSPFIEDPDAGITLSESGAITDYIIWKYGNGRLALKPDNKNFSEYLHWKDFSNATLQPAMLTLMFLKAAQISEENQMLGFANQRLHEALKLMDDRLKDSKWLAGDEFTAADTMSVYPVTTQRYWGPQVSLKEYPNLLRWLKDCSERPAYQKAMEKGDPDMVSFIQRRSRLQRICIALPRTPCNQKLLTQSQKVLIGAEAPGESLLAAGGSESSIWRK